MKALLATLLAFVLTSPSWAENPAVSRQSVGAEATLTVAAHYVDRLFMSALHSLTLIASTPEAKNGDWQGIKPYLKQLESDLPGVYFYVFPDGNYYSVALDYTNLNLSNRPYFKSLFTGHPIKGFPIYSRSSGRKSALVAAPIMVNNKVEGALGASIFLDDLTVRLEHVITLPQDYNWFVLNADATNMLDRDSDFIFMNALEQGSPSLKKAVTKALASERGAIRYQLESPREGYFEKLPNMEWWMFLVKVEGGATAAPAQLKLSLERFVPALQEHLNRLDRLLSELITSREPPHQNENSLRKLLRDILEVNLPVVEASFVDATGVMQYIEPPEYRNFENTDISSQAHILAMQQTPVPQLTPGFMTVERFLAVIIAHPLFARDGSYAGRINLVIRPDFLVEPLLKSSKVPEDYELWIMQPDGLILYDQDPDEIGKMLFGDPLYASHGNLLELGKRIAAAPTGEGDYIFLSPKLKQKVIKKAIWQTVSLHGQEWRVVLAYRPYES